MILIPTSPVPNQTLTVVLATQRCDIALRQNGRNLYFDLRVNGADIVKTRLVRNKQRLLLDAQYRGVAGDFLFADLQGNLDPAYFGLGSRYQLYYLEQSDL